LTSRPIPTAEQLALIHTTQVQVAEQFMLDTTTREEDPTHTGITQVDIVAAHQAATTQAHTPTTTVQTHQVATAQAHTAPIHTAATIQAQAHTPTTQVQVAEQFMLDTTT
jgi:hypothetical protein